MKTFKELNDLVIQWGKDKGIVGNATPLQQFGKTQEEVNELQEALIAQNNGLEYYINSKGKKVNTKEEIKDGIADTVVTLILQCELQDTDMVECLNMVYDIISKRTGKLINGQFVKDN